MIAWPSPQPSPGGRGGRRLAAALLVASVVLGLACSSGGGGGGGGKRRGGSGGGAGTGTGTGTGSGTAGGASAGGIPIPPGTGTLLAGVASRPISPLGWETWLDLNGDSVYQASEPYLDTGLDRLFDHDEAGALGADGAPGRAGVDDDGNGTVDDAPAEYLAAGSDDVRDPAGDNFHLTTNSAGTERDGRFAMVPLAGYQGYYAILDGLDPQWRPMTAKLDDIESRSLAISDGAGTDVIIQSNDLVGMLHLDINPVKRRLERDLGVPFDHIIIASTHVHSGPDPVGLWAGTRFDLDWVMYVRDQMYESAKAAWLARRPAAVRSAAGQPDSAYDPVTLVPKKEPNVRHASDWHAQKNAAPGTYDTLTLQHDIRDPLVRNTEVVAMQLADPQTGDTIATVLNFANHPEVLEDRNLFLSSDWPGFARARMEREYGGLCVYFTGTCGGQIGANAVGVAARDAGGQPIYQPGVVDANGDPVPVFLDDASVDKIRSLGFIVAETAIEALDRQAWTPAPALAIRTEDLYVDFENPFFIILAYTLQLLGRGERADDPIRQSWAVSPIGVMATKVSVATVGDAQLVTFPGEVCPEYFIGRGATYVDYSWDNYGTYPFPAKPAVRDFMTGRERMALGLANAYHGYLTPSSDYINLWDRDHPNYYEEQVSAGWNSGDACGNKLMQMLGSTARFSSYPTRP